MRYIHHTQFYLHMQSHDWLEHEKPNRQTNWSCKWSLTRTKGNDLFQGWTTQVAVHARYLALPIICYNDNLYVAEFKSLMATIMEDSARSAVDCSVQNHWTYSDVIIGRVEACNLPTVCLKIHCTYNYIPAFHLRNGSYLFSSGSPSYRHCDRPPFICTTSVYPACNKRYFAAHQQSPLP